MSNGIEVRSPLAMSRGEFTEFVNLEINRWEKVVAAIKRCLRASISYYGSAPWSA